MFGTMKKLAAFMMAGMMTVAAIPVQAAENQTPYKIGWSFMTTDGAIMSALIKKAEMAAEELGVEFFAVGASNDPSKQIENFEAFTQAGYDAIIVQPIDGPSMSTYTKKAMEQGIKIIDFGPALEEGCYDYFYRNDNQTTGTVIGEMAAEWINSEKDGKANICIIGSSQFEYGVVRRAAIESVLSEKCPDSEIVAFFDAYSTAEGQDGMESALAAHPEIDCIVSVIDDMAIGAYQALKAAGYDKEGVGIFGSDMSTTALEYIMNDTCYKGTTDIEIREISAKALQLAVDVLNGDSDQYDSTEIIMDVIPVTIENASEYVDYFEKMAE